MTALQEVFTSAHCDDEDETDGDVEGDTCDTEGQNTSGKFSTSEDEGQAMACLHSRLRMSLMYYFAEVTGITYTHYTLYI